MRHSVLLTAGAERDLQEIVDYIAEFDSPTNAGRVLDRILETVDSLAAFPERGSYPRELSALGIREFRQIHFKPYRLIYRIVNKIVYVHVIANGRRDMQSLLTRRLVSD